MNGLLPEGENLRFEGLEQPLQIERALGAAARAKSLPCSWGTSDWR